MYIATLKCKSGVDFVGLGTVTVLDMCTISKCGLPTLLKGEVVPRKTT